MPNSISFLRALGLLWALAVVPISACLLWFCVTLDGAIFGTAAVALGAAPALWSWGFGNESPWLGRNAMACLLLWVLLTCWLFLHRPDGHARSGARVSNQYVGGGWHYNARALGALLPEVDHFMLGFKLVPALDPLFTMQQARKMSALTRTIYAELEADADFHALGSVMPDVYDDLWLQRFDHGNYFF